MSADLDKYLKINLLLHTGVTLATISISGCGSSSPAGNLPSLTASNLLTSSANTNVVVGSPRKIYQRIARKASKCWFGPFGSDHNRYLMSAYVPPPTSKEPVTIAVHRRLRSVKKPWGPTLLRVEFSGTSTTTLTFQNVGLDSQTLNRMTNGITGWANGSKICSALHGAEPKWAPQDVSTTSQAAKRRK